MSDVSLQQAIDNIYVSLKADNAELLERIAELKAAMARDGVKEAVFEPAKLAQNNRQGRKLMQAFFRKHGISVSFSS